MAKKCPCCGSSNTTKTNTGSQIAEGVVRFAGAAIGAWTGHSKIGGLFVGGVADSEYKCKNCGHKFK